MKNAMKTDTAVIGGTGFKRWFEKERDLPVGTPYGIVSSISVGRVEGKEIVFLPRHGADHSIPPHKINYQANIYALHKMGVKRVLATNAVGAINLNFSPGEMVIPHDFVDFTKNRHATFYDQSPVTHVDFSQPYCPEIRRQLMEAAERLDLGLKKEAVLVCTEGPRYETPAEIEMFRILGGDVVGMTGIPEAVLARELEMCYSSICFVSNMASGAQNKLTVQEISQVSNQILSKISQLLTETINCLPSERSCPCSTALKESRIP